jgi:hypothetical protein
MQAICHHLPAGMSGRAPPGTTVNDTITAR